jgi:flagellar P-ring protein precursor FlgI
LSSSRFWAGLFLLGGGLLAAAAPSVRIKDIATVRGLRGNQLLGIGLVTGLAGRGDSSNSALLRNALSALVANFGFRVSPEEVRSRNCAVVSVSAEVPAFVRPGDPFEVRVASLGDARSLEGGVLLQTPLKGANSRIYALAQGQVFTVGTGTGQKTVGSIPSGAIAEQEILSSFLQGDTLALVLKDPDFVTSSAVAGAIRQALPASEVRPVDASLVELKVPEDRRGDPVGFIAQLESLAVTPDASGRVVIDSSSGIIIFGEKVRIGKVAVSYKDISVRVGQGPALGQFRESKPEQFTIGENTTVEELVNTLRTIGLNTETVIHLLRAIDKAGSLYGTLVVL